MDVAFIIDSSGSISRRNYMKLKTFVKESAKSFGLAPNQSQAAMVLYSTTASVKARFGEYATMEEFAKAVDALPHERGQTRIDRALDLAATDIFPEARAGVPKLALLITDGRQTQASDAKGLREAYEPLRKAGVRVLVLGIGSVDQNELRLVTETDDDIVVVTEFQDMLLKIGDVISRACLLAGECGQSWILLCGLALAFARQV